MRTCPKCKIEKPLTTENFGRSKAEIGGFQYCCKPCTKIHYKRKPWKPHTEEQKAKCRKTGLAYKKNRWHNDPDFKLQHSLRSRLLQYLKKGRQDTSISFLGCSIKEWREYLESKWSDDMHWGNHGDYWEIDHIHPLSKGGSFHYTNTQPLTKTENRKKGDKID